ncbi:MAG: outer membrane protein assembly factor BamD [Rhodanobacter sp.]
MRLVKQSMRPQFAAKLLVLLVLVALLGACSIFGSKRNQDDYLPVDALYNKAHGELQQSRYSTSIQTYQRLIARFPSGNYNEHAQLDLAYAQYKDNKPDDALSTINRFIKTYPANKHVDYAYYLRGLIDFDREGGFLERFLKLDDSQTRRDPAPFLQSFDDFSELSRRFPNGAYAADARLRMIYLRNQLAQYEINIAEFYLRHRAFVAAADRAQYVIEHYQQAPQTGDALALLTRSYLALNQDTLASQSRKVLALNYPDHPYLTDPKWPRAPSTVRKLIPFSGHH